MPNLFALMFDGSDHPIAGVKLLAGSLTWTFLDDAFHAQAGRPGFASLFGRPGRPETSKITSQALRVARASVMADAHERGSHGQAASFSFVCDVDGNGGDACLGARCGTREWAGKGAKHGIHPRLFRCLESSVLSVVRAARIGPRPGEE
jgi:hypothetical protein